MPDFVIPFAEDDAGNPCTVPGTAVKLSIKKKRPEGKPGRPKLLTLDGAPYEPTFPVTGESIAILPNGDYIADAIDASGKRVGARIHFSVEHLSQPGADTEGTSGMSVVTAELLGIVKQLKGHTDTLQDTLVKTVDKVSAALDKVADALVEQTKATAPVVEAAATLVETARSGGLGKVMDDLRLVWDAMPESSNQLETVLKSPVVTGAMMMIQKFIAKLAKDAADGFAGFGEPSEEHEAARVGRAYHKMRAEQERRAALGE